jgi:hypothetical protein
VEAVNYLSTSGTTFAPTIDVSPNTTGIELAETTNLSNYENYFNSPGGFTLNYTQLLPGTRYSFRLTGITTTSSPNRFQHQTQQSAIQINTQLDNRSLNHTSAIARLANDDGHIGNIYWNNPGITTGHYADSDYRIEWTINNQSSTQQGIKLYNNVDHRINNPIIPSGVNLHFFSQESYTIIGKIQYTNHLATQYVNSSVNTPYSTSLSFNTPTTNLGNITVVINTITYIGNNLVLTFNGSGHDFLDGHGGTLRNTVYDTGYTPNNLYRLRLTITEES